ncbi:DNA repair protein RadA [subsurface metagenome]
MAKINDWAELTSNELTYDLSVKQEGGAILLNCFDGCDKADILKPLGLELQDLFLNSHKANKSEHREIEAIYQYEGFEVVRTRPKGFYQRRPDGKGGYINNLKGIVPTLYHQRELESAVLHDDTIFITAGEKDCDALWDIGLVATTNPGGEGKWKAAYSETLRGGNIVVLPDKDETGRKHGHLVATSLYVIAKTLKIVELPGDDVNDVSDWLEAGGDDLQLKEIAKAAPNWIPDSTDTASIILRRIADVEPEDVKWLWYPYVPYGKLTLLEGDPGTGKSWLGLGIAAAQSRGQGLPGVNGLKPGNVLIISAEDGLADTIRPRLSASEADITRIYALDGLFTLDRDGCELLESYIRQLKPLLVIIDPLVAYLSGEVDVHKANQVRQVTAHLARLAEKYNPAIIAIRHLTKGSSLKPIYRGLGSIDFTAAARSVLLAGSDPDFPQTRGICHLKCNLAPLGESIGYELRETGFFWTGHSELTTDRILAGSDGSSALEEAKTFLLDVLRDGAVPANEVKEEAEARGISERTLNRAKANLKVGVHRIGEEGKRGKGQWHWELSEDESF